MEDANRASAITPNPAAISPGPRTLHSASGPSIRGERLVDPAEGVREDNEQGLVAEDFGIDGGAASAEEAAMHITEPPD